MSDYRAKFPQKGQQSNWLNSLSLSVKDIAVLCSRSERTVRDWRREKFLMNYKALLILSRHVNICMPCVEKVPRYAHLRLAGQRGGESVIKKYGKVPADEKIRLIKWNEWWSNEGKYRSNTILSPHSFCKPEHSVELAEFVGIMLGDGGLSGRQLSITLHAVDDFEYGEFISKLLKKLFSVPVSRRHKNDSATNDYIVSRVGLVDYCVKEIGLVRGDKIKNRADIPIWIKKDKRYTSACLRGLIDTDGSIYDHTYKVKGKIYSYKKLNFSSRSELLLRFVFDSMTTIGLHPRSYKSYICLERQSDVSMYMSLVGTNNPKHLKRYRK